MFSCKTTTYYNNGQLASYVGDKKELRIGENAKLKIIGIEWTHHVVTQGKCIKVSLVKIEAKHM